MNNFLELEVLELIDMFRNYYKEENWSRFVDF